MGRTAAVPRRAESRIALLVDRDDDTRQMYAEFLKQRAWEVVEAADGAEALIKALARRPSVIVTETRLPVVDGFELCERLRQESTTASIPILVVTADAYAPDLERVRVSGADLVLIKPCLPESLGNEMQQLVDAALARPQMRSAPKPARARRNGSRSIAKAPPAESTTTPPAAPPQLDCPGCRRPLVYQRSHLGKSPAERQREQRDYYVCPGGCGHFQYRHRTGGLRPI